MGKSTAIVVTHNSSRFVTNLIESLAAQTRRIDHLKIVDSGSTGTEYLDVILERDWPFQVTLTRFDNIGFCKANNTALADDGTDFWLLINPDAAIAPDWLEQAVRFLALPSESKTGMVSSRLQGFDIAANRPTGRYDSCGIYRTWYGRWYDAAQGLPVSQAPAATSPVEPEAICGALMLVRDEVVRQLIRADGQFFDESFFMYKDDIDLSLRVRKLGWRLKLLPGLTAYHCRGWQSDRGKMREWQRCRSAVNEIKIALKNASPYLIVYVGKYFYVKYLEPYVLHKR